MDSLSVIIVLLIVGIVADGLRRVIKARRADLQLSRRAQELDGEAIKVSSSEFPSGGARVVTKRAKEDADNLNTDMRKNYESSRVTVGAPKRDPEQASLNLEEVVPMLMDPLEPEPQEQFSFEENEPALGDMNELDDVSDPPKDAPQDKPETKTAAAEENSERGETEVLVVSVMAKTGERFLGADLLETLMDLNMKFGDMDIFHRHQYENGDGEVYFSLANMVVPGTFNLAEMDDFSTPGISLFMQLPLTEECNSLEAFDIFATCARTLSSRLQGELKDENRSVMTSQTFEHYRQRVIEFERRQKLQHN